MPSPESRDAVFASALGRDSLLVLIPAYNEAAAIGATLESLRAVGGEIVVIDDGSRDDTASIALRHGATVLRHVINRGQGAALQTGLSYAGRSGRCYVCTIDADGQHDPADIAPMLQGLQRQNLDIVLGSRFKGSTVDMPWLRRLVLKGAVIFTWITAGILLTDAHNGLRVMTIQTARQLNLRQDRMAYASELIERIKALKLRFGEMPVTIRYTDYSLTKGQKNVGLFRNLERPLHVLAGAMISQYILTAILVFLEVYFATAEGGSRLTRIAVCIILLGGIGLVWRPDLSNTLAHAVGISRGADLLMYLWILISFLIIGRLRLRLWRLEHEITVVVRHVALAEARGPVLESTENDNSN